MNTDRECPNLEIYTQVAAEGSRRCIRCQKGAPTAVGGYDLSADRARSELSGLNSTPFG